MHCRLPDSKALTPGRELEKSNLELPSLLQAELPQSLISVAGKIIEQAKCQILFMEEVKIIWHFFAAFPYGATGRVI